MDIPAHLVATAHPQEAGAMDRHQRNMGVSDFRCPLHSDTMIPDGCILLVEATKMSCQVRSCPICWCVAWLVWPDNRAKLVLPRYD